MSGRAQQAGIVEIDGVPVRIVRKSVKNMNLRVDRAGNVSLSIPRACRVDEACRYLARMSGWIAKNRAKALLRAPLAPSLYRTGDATYIWGVPHTLEIAPSSRCLAIALDDKAKKVSLSVPERMLDRSGGEAAALPVAIAAMRKRLLDRRLEDLRSFAESRVGAHAMEWHTRSMRTRWGSCSLKTGRICLAAELAAYPYACAQQVACHEACHLLVPNHSQRFYAELDRALPSWREARQVLKDTPRLP